MRRSSIGFAQSWLAMGAAAAFVLSPGTAAATIGPGVIVGGNYQQSTTSVATNPATEGSSCADNSHCYFRFSPVPSGKQLVVTQVSCIVTVLGGSMVTAALWPYRNNETLPLRRSSLVHSNPAANTFVLNNTTLQLFVAGDRPLVRVQVSNATSTVSGECNISGQRINAP